MDVSRETPHFTTKPKCYDLTSILVRSEEDTTRSDKVRTQRTQRYRTLRRGTAREQSNQCVTMAQRYSTRMHEKRG